jgi:Ca-activated chloride channel homolog
MNAPGHRPVDRGRRALHRWGTAVPALVVVASVAVWGAPAASASAATAVAPKSISASGSGAVPAGTTVPVMIVLDASGSMNQDDAPGPRIDAAKAAVKNLVTGLPADAQVGLMVYGTSTGSTDAEKAAGCQDISTLIPVSTLDTAALTAAVDGVHASGYTPIGNALRAASDALPRATWPLS